MELVVSRLNWAGWDGLGSLTLHRGMVRVPLWPFERVEACSSVTPAQTHSFHAFFQLPAPWSPSLQPPSSFIHLVNTLKVKMKSFTTDWDLNPHAGTRNQPKPNLGLKPMWLLKSAKTLLGTWTHVTGTQFSSVAQSCLTLCDPMNCSMPGLPVHHQLPEFTQSHVHWVSDAIQPSHPLSSPSLPALNLSQHQGLCKWVSSLHLVTNVLEFQL